MFLHQESERRNKFGPFTAETRDVFLSTNLYEIFPSNALSLPNPFFLIINLVHHLPDPVATKSSILGPGMDFFVLVLFFFIGDMTRKRDFYIVFIYR